MISEQQLEMIAYFIENNRDDLLREMAAGYTKHIPIELIHEQDRAFVEMVNYYFANKAEIIELIREKAYGQFGTFDLNFSHNDFHVTATMTVRTSHSPGDNLTPSSTDSDIEINNLIIRI